MAVAPISVSPRTYRHITRVALIALVFIVVSGGAVRLTGSGLGCTDWPNCSPGSLTPVSAGDLHAMVEFVNRLVTGLVSVAVIVAVLGSLRRSPRRRDLTVLSLGLVAGVIGQIVLGGITVLVELSPPFVMGHFLLSMVLIGNAMVLVHRAEEDEGPRVPVVDAVTTMLGRLLLVAATLVLFTGTVVTAAGPHAGDADVDRLNLDITEAARLHGGSVIMLVAITLVLMRHLRRSGAPPSANRAGELLLLVLVAQAGIGYTQYFNGVPALLVGFHLLGASLVWLASLHLTLKFSRPAIHPGTRVPPLTPAVRGSNMQS